jgi:hypothetical protein
LRFVLRFLRDRLVKEPPETGERIDHGECATGCYLLSLGEQHLLQLAIDRV